MTGASLNLPSDRPFLFRVTSSPGYRLRRLLRSFTIHHIPPKPAGRDLIPIKKQAGPIRESDLKASAPREGLVFNDANAV
jgi:hypothetical protein